MAKPKGLAIFTTALGNRTFAERAIAALNQIDDIEFEYICVGAEDFKTHPAPWWARPTDPWESRYIARRKARPQINENVRLLLVFSWEYVIEFQDIAKRIPAAAFVDAVPSTVNAHLRRRGHTGWKRRLSHEVHHRAFRAAVPHYRFFLAWGSDAAEALEREYSVDRKRCLVTLIPQDLDLWTPGPPTSSPGLRLMFAGNDFYRKGGEFLLQLFADHLSSFCTLTIASNDPIAESLSLPAGVEWLPGRDRAQLLEIYRRSDVFIFPTLQDYAATNVVCEALACGVPCIANDVGGIRDVVRDETTGFLMPLGAPASVWAQRIEALHTDRHRLAQLAAGARRFAEENLSTERFRENLAGVIRSLLSGPTEQLPPPRRCGPA